MAIFTITTQAQVNQSPTRIGDRSFTLDYDELLTFTVADFTTATLPTYLDPEGDPLQSIQVKTLPTIGSLELNSVAVTALDEITAADITSGLLTYQCDDTETSGYTDDSMTFDVKDTGSLSFAGLTGTVDFTVGAEVNQPPSSVGDNSATTAYDTTIVFTVAQFTTGTTPAYADPEGDAADLLKITSLPAKGKLKLNNVDVVLNQEIDFTDIAAGDFTYVPDITDLAGDSLEFKYEIADAGSGIFTG